MGRRERRADRDDNTGGDGWAAAGTNIEGRVHERGPAANRNTIMSTVPPGRSAAITWFTQRLSTWTANAAQIGLSSEQVTSLTGLTQTASNSLSNANQKRNESKAATQDFHNDADAMRELGTSLVATIKAFAKASGDPSVYALAQIPEPADPAPTPAPGQTYEFETQILVNGALRVRFKCDNPGAQGGTAGGVSYEVRRQDDGTGAFTFVLNAGEREFTDATLPGGLNTATYRITAFRSTQQGDPAEFNVRFGVGNGVGGQQQTARVTGESRPDTPGGEQKAA